MTRKAKITNEDLIRHYDEGYRAGNAGSQSEYERGRRHAFAELNSSDHPRVNVSAIFVGGNGLKCSGALCDIPWNPHAQRIWPQFEVCWNGRWILVEVIDWSQDFGWIAQEVDSLESEDLHISPRVELRKAGAAS